MLKLKVSDRIEKTTYFKLSDCISKVFINCFSKKTEHSYVSKFNDIVTDAKLINKERKV